jgi:DNA-binding NtrC family response regulator
MAERFKVAKRKAVGHFEQQYLDSLLVYHEGNVTRAAKEAGMLRPALQRLMRKHRLKSADYRRRAQAVSA